MRQRIYERVRTGASLSSIAIVAVIVCGLDRSFGAVKRVPYPEVKVEISKTHDPDPSFWRFWKAFETAVKDRNDRSLFSLVGPTFVWTIEGQLAENFDLGRDALHNFKVVFGFREHGRSTDDATKDGPYWDALSAFASDPSFYKASETTGLTCGPIIAEVANAYVFDAAQKSIAVDNDYGDWYFTAQSTQVTRSPSDPTPIGILEQVAFPVISLLKSETPASPNQLEVLLPSGKVGWINATAARPLSTDQLCYSKTEKGDWTIVNFDESDD